MIANLATLLLIVGGICLLTGAIYFILGKLGIGDE